MILADVKNGTRGKEAGAKETQVAKSPSETKSVERMESNGPTPQIPVANLKFLSKFYKVHEVIGKGGFSVVHRATHLDTEEPVAIKIVDKKSAANQELVVKAAIDQELRLLKRFQHPNVCKLYHEIQTSDYLCMVQEYYPGGELFHYVKSNERLSEGESQRIFRQIACGLEYLHQNGVCHRDLKLENVLLDSSLNAKLIDFGLCAVHSKDVVDDQPLNMFCGSPAYAAPELVSSKPYIGFKSDVWSLGVVLYCCLNGYFPFYSAVHSEMYKMIQEGKYDEPKWLSEGSKTMISWLLQLDPNERPSITEIVMCEWCKGSAGSAEESTKEENISSPGHNNWVLGGVGERIDTDIVKKMADFYELHFEGLVNSLNLNDCTSYLACTYFLLVDRRKKYGQRASKLFGVRIPNTYVPNVRLQSGKECGDGDHIVKDLEKLEPINSDTGNLNQPKALGVFKCAQEHEPESKSLTLGHLLRRISSSFGRNKNSIRDLYTITPSATIIDPLITLTILKAALHIKGIQYSHKGMTVEGFTKDRNNVSKLLKFDVEITVKDFIVRPLLGTVQLSWKRRQGSNELFKRIVDEVTFTMNNL